MKYEVAYYLLHIIKCNLQTMYLLTFVWSSCILGSELVCVLFRWNSWSVWWVFSCKVYLVLVRYKAETGHISNLRIPDMNDFRIHKVLIWLDISKLCLLIRTVSQYVSRNNTCFFRADLTPSISTTSLRTGRVFWRSSCILSCRLSRRLCGRGGI